MRGTGKAGNGGGTRPVEGVPGETENVPTQKKNPWAGWKDRFKKGAESYQPNPDDLYAPITAAPVYNIPPRQQFQMPQQQGLFRNYNPAQMYPYGGAFRTGGRFKAGKRIRVGEDGPEEIVLDQPGEVIANAPAPPINPTLDGTVPKPATPAAQTPFAQSVSNLGSATFGTPAGYNTVAENPAAQPPMGMFRRPEVVGVPSTLSEMQGEAEAPTPLSPVEESRNKIEALDKGMPPANYKREGNPVSRFFKGMFRGWKNWDGQGGLLGGLVSSLADGISDAADPKNALGHAIKSERNKLFRNLNYQMAMQSHDNKQNTEIAQAANYQNQMANRNAGTMLDAQKIEQNAIWDEWKANSTFDPSDPRHRSLIEKARRLGINLPKKEKGQTWKRFSDPDGTVGYYNDEGEEKITGNRAKPKDIDTKVDVSDAEFGLYDDKRLENLATAKIAPSIKGRTIRPNILAIPPPQYKNEDGTFNESAYLSDLNNGETELRPNDIYEDLPSNYKQRLAGEIERIRKSQDGLRKQLTRFRSELNHRMPNPNSPAVTLGQVKQWFKEALENKDDPKAKLDTFFKILRQTNIK